MKPTLQIALVIDDYKLPNKEDFWNKALGKVPIINQHYELVREEVAPGVTRNTTSLIRHYKLKEKT